MQLSPHKFIDHHNKQIYQVFSFTTLDKVMYKQENDFNKPIEL